MKLSGPAAIALGLAVVVASGAAGVAIGRSTASNAPAAPATSTRKPPRTTTTESLPVLSGPTGTFAGLWEVHGHMLTIDPSGYGIMDWRVYTTCGNGVRPPCDIFSGNEILDGGHATLLLNATGPTSANGEVLSTSDPVDVPLGPFTARIDPVRDLLYPSLPLYAKYPLCGQKAETMSVPQQQAMGINCGA